MGDLPPKQKVGLVFRTKHQERSIQALLGALCTAIAAAIPSAVLDGEIVCLDGEDKPQFYELMRRRLAPTYCAFDLSG